VYFSLNGENAVGKVDVGTRQLVGKVAVGAGPIQVFVTPDGRRVLAANQGTEASPSDTVSIIDTASLEVAATVKTDAGAHGVVIEPTGRYAYIANIYGDTVSVLDIAGQAVIATVASGEGPNGISFSPRTPRAAGEVQLEVPHIEDEPGMEGMEH
jgi:YVTN family beta-propeller protein